MRLIACILVILTSCTSAPKREPAQACTAFDKPLDMSNLRESATETLNQYNGILQYMQASFFPRLQREMERSSMSCEIQQMFRGLQADIAFSLRYFQQKQQDSQQLGMRLLDPRVIEKINCMKPLVSELRPAFDQLKSNLAVIAQSLSEWQKTFKEPPFEDCGQPKEWPGLRQALPSLLQSSGAVSGSAFIAEAGGTKYIVTAAHVSNVGLKSKELLLTTKNENGLIEQEMMSLTAGEIDLALDISFKKTARPTRPLKVAKAAELANLKPGHKFYALGFPLVAKGRIDAIPCVFEGFAPGQRKSREAQMLLYCFGRGNSVGASGGPLVDEDGRVWGMNASQAAYSGALLATPVLELDGKLQQGVGLTFQSEYCYNRNLTYRGSCTVMPNMFETQVP